MRNLNLFFLGILNILILAPDVIMAQGQSEKPRTIVTTDGEVDDVDSFIRFLLYANEFDIAGLVVFNGDISPSSGFESNIP